MTPRQTAARIAGGDDDAHASAFPSSEGSPLAAGDSPSDSDRDDLGPSLVAEDVADGAGRAAARPAPAEIDPAVWRTTVVQLDALLSATASLDAEPRDVLDPIADGMYPLVKYYAGRAPSVASLWLVGGLSALAYGSVKVARYRDARARAATEAEPDSEAEVNRGREAQE